MEPLGDYLADQGYLIVNTRYALATMDRAAFPEAVEDVACAVRYAAGHADSDGTVAVIGHSAGAHIGAVVALTGDDYRGDCGFPGSGLPERFIGLAGPYDVSRLGLAIAAFFGGGPEVLPDAWQAGNPQLLTGENTDLESLIMYGELDRLVPETFAVDFHEALVEAGSVSTIELVEGARHNDVHVPDLVGELIATWLRRSNP
jgi:acetyl esterase/lipase